MAAFPADHAAAGVIAATEVLPREAVGIASPTTSSKVGDSPPSSAIVSTLGAPLVLTHGSEGKPNPFELREHNGTKFPVWRESGMVPLIAFRRDGLQRGDAFGLPPEAARRAILAKEASFDGRAILLVGPPTGIDAGILLQSSGMEVGTVRADGGALQDGIMPDGRDIHGNVVLSQARVTRPGEGEPLVSASGPQPVPNRSSDMRENIHPESKSIPPPPSATRDTLSAAQPVATGTAFPGNALTGAGTLESDAEKQAREFESDKNKSFGGSGVPDDTASKRRGGRS